MYLSLDFIASELNATYPLVLRGADGLFVQFKMRTDLSKLPSCRSIRLCKTAQTAAPQLLKNGTLYLIEESSDAPNIAPSKDACAIYIGHYEPPRGINAIWITSNADACTVFNDVEELFERYSSWARAVDDALLERRPLAEAVALLSQVTPNPFWLSDDALRVIATSGDCGLSKRDPAWRAQLEKRRFSPETISSLVSSGDLDRLERHAGAWLFESETGPLGIPFASRALRVNGSLVGYVCCIQLDPSHCTRDLELCEYLGEAIERFSKREQDPARARELRRAQALRSLIAGNDLDEAGGDEALSLLSWTDDTGLIVAAFDRGSARELQQRVPEAQTQLVRELLGFGQVFSYDRYIVAFCDTKRLSYDAVEDKIDDAARRLGWKAGVSDEFRGATGAAAFYGQAQIALAEGAQAMPDRSSYRYRDWAASYLCRMISCNSREAFYLHPDLARLADHDAACASHLEETIESFLSNDGSTARVAEDLSIHRNTVAYRLESARNVMQADLDNADVRLDLALSLKTRTQARRAGRATKEGAL